MRNGLKRIKLIMSRALTKIQAMHQKKTLPTCLCNFPPFLPTKAASRPVISERIPAITCDMMSTFSMVFAFSSQD